MTRTQVRYLLGTPMVPNVFDKDRWDYLFYFRHGRHPYTQRQVIVHFKDDKVAQLRHGQHGDRPAADSPEEGPESRSSRRSSRGCARRAARAPPGRGAARAGRAPSGRYSSMRSPSAKPSVRWRSSPKIPTGALSQGMCAAAARRGRRGTGSASASAMQASAPRVRLPQALLLRTGPGDDAALGGLGSAHGSAARALHEGVHERADGLREQRLEQHRGEAVLEGEASR